MFDKPGMGFGQTEVVAICDVAESSDAWMLEPLVDAPLEWLS
jgi:hypothetical protein